MDEKRIHPRVNIELDVVCELEDHAPVTGRSKDLSLGGMFIESSETLPFNTKLTLVTRFPDGEVRLPSIVRWSKPDGFGVQFQLLGARETHALTKLMRQ